LTEKNPELFDLVVSYRKKIDRKTHQPFSYRKISALIKEEHNLSISFKLCKTNTGRCGADEKGR
jgi:hypothetical protein